MRKVLIAVLAILAIVTAVIYPRLSQQLRADTKPSKPLTVKVGDTAPDFTLLAFDGKELKKVSLTDYRGKKNVALAFYVFAFTGG
jgi:cytochrome oxidase Cu insertion factor (SCO1/SenC/PrrC family)